MSGERDIELRRAAMDRARELQRRYDDLVPVPALRGGFVFDGRRVSFGSFYSGIFRPKEMTGPAALSLVTAAPKLGRPAPYEDQFDEQTGRFTYRFRDPQVPSVAAERQAQADNRALLAAHELGVPVIYFRGIAPGQYAIVAPAFVMAVDRVRRLVELEAGLPVADMTPSGLLSDDDVRRYATREALVRLHQHRFRAAVLRAYSTRCAVCQLREASLLQAAHIVDDRDPQGNATIVNGIACARSTTWPMTATYSESIPGGSCTSLVACSTSTTGRCCAMACRAFTARRYFSRAVATNVRIPTASRSGSRSSLQPRELLGER